MNMLAGHAEGTQGRQQALQQLVQLWQQGDQVACFNLAKSITVAFPNAGIAWKLLGVLYPVFGQAEQGVTALLTAQKWLPRDADVVFNLGNAYAKAGQYVQAIAAYQKTIKLTPMFVQAYENLGSVYHLQQDLTAAQKTLSKAIAYNPKSAFAHAELGLVLHKQGKPKQAMQYYRQALQLQPADAISHYNLAQALEDLGDDEQAQSHYEMALARQSGYIDAYFNLGYLHKRHKRYEAANQYFTSILNSQPDHERALQVLADSHLERGDVHAFVDTYLKAVGDDNAFAPEKLNDMVAMLLDKNLPNEAEKYCQMALEKAPDSPLILNNMGLICFSRNDPKTAVHYFEKAIAAKPDFVQAYSNGALPLLKMGQVNEAIDYLNRAVAINPDYFAAYVNLGMAHSESGNIPQALACLEKALQIKPDNIKPIQSILFLSAYHRESINARYFELLAQFGSLTASQAKPAHCWRIHPEDQRIKIGFVSGDLKHHPVGLFLKPVLQQLDQSKFDVFIYSNSVLEDKITHELKTYVSQWQVISHLSDEMAARKIHEDGVHILIDLSGHTSLNRLPMFAWKPAPLQISWLGYWASTGMPAIDYLIADAVSVPQQQQSQFTEQVAYLPDTRLCFSKPAYDIPVADLPALATGHVTLGCYHKYTKATDEVLALWCEVLRQLPTAQLRWQTTAFGDPKMVAAARERFAAFGIDAARCSFLAATSIEAYLHSHAEVDFILDTFPFTGGTTTCDALWMGVPTLTLAGEHLIARQGASLMTAAGLPDWVVNDQAAFVTQAIAFAADLDGLAQLRASLRPRLQTSALFNGERFTQGFSQLLSTLWTQQQGRMSQEQFTALKPLAHQASSAPLCVISATHRDEAAFWRDSALGRSLQRHMQKDDRIQAHICFEQTGIATALNQAIAEASEAALLMLAHDDVWLDEPNLWQAAYDGTQHYDVLSAAGSSSSAPMQPHWAYLDLAGNEQAPDQLLGILQYGQHPFGNTRHYGPAQGNATLLDGRVLITTKAVLDAHALGFDPRFDTHCYDMDFCRTAVQADLKLGVWPMAVTVATPALPTSPDWYAQFETYVRKWEHPEAVVSAPLTGPLRDMVEEVFGHALDAHQRGDLRQAAALYQEILTIDSGHALSMHNLAHIAWKADADAETLTTALAQFKQAYLLASTTWQCLSSYVTALAQSDQATLAKAVLAAAPYADPEQVATLAAQLGLQTLASTLANPVAVMPAEETQQALLALFDRGEYQQLVDTLYPLLQAYPDWLEGWKMLTDNLMLLKQDARTAAQRALALNPDDAREHCYYGMVLKTQGDFTGAASAFEQAVTLAPDYAAAWNNWGLVLKDMGQLEQSVIKFEQALHLQPAYAECFSNVLFCLSHVDGISQASLLALHQVFAERYEQPLMAAWPTHRPTERKPAVLNIGLVSADFRAHSMAHFLLPVLPLLAKQPQLKLFAYANQSLEDAVTTQMQDAFALWRKVDQWSEDALADGIRADGIDILIDLSGHTAGNRLLTFARKPAPIQISWLGYLHSTGLRAMDYYLVDAQSAPAGMLDDQFSEQVLRLPVEAAFQPLPDAPDVNALPALSNGYITFGCFNRPGKMTRSTIALWGALLRQLPDSRLVLGGMGNAESSQGILVWLQAEGVTADRVTLLARTDMQTYLQQYHMVDLCLDTVPSSGVTTTLHALWMGVPTLCIAGDTLRSRGAMTQMRNIGLAEFVATDAEDFVRKGLDVAHDRLSQLRQQLRTQMLDKQTTVNHALCDCLVDTFQRVWSAYADAEAQ